MTRSIARSTQLRRLAPAILIATAAFGAVAGVSTALPPSASAEFGFWDVIAYDDCATDVTRGTPDPTTINELLKVCCMNSDGVWDYQHNKCVAPPGNGPRSRQVGSDIGVETVSPRPPIHVPSDIGIATFTPTTSPESHG